MLGAMATMLLALWSRIDASQTRLRSEFEKGLEALRSEACDLGNRLESLRSETRESVQQLQIENREAHRSLGDRVEGVRQKPARGADQGAPTVHGRPAMP